MQSAPKIKFTLKAKSPTEQGSSPSGNLLPTSPPSSAGPLQDHHDIAPAGEPDQDDTLLTEEQQSSRKRADLEHKLLGAIDLLWQMELRAGDVQETNKEFMVKDM